MVMNSEQEIAYKPGRDMSELILRLLCKEGMDISGGKYRESAVM